jgi:hypothetical protein
VAVYADRLYALIAKKHATTIMPMSHASATQMLLPTGLLISRERIASTMEVTGWFSAKARTGPGMDAVGTKAELINGRKING